MFDFVKKFSIDLGNFIKEKLESNKMKGIYQSIKGKPVIYDIDILAEEYIRNYFDKYKPPFKVISEDSKVYDVVKDPKYVVIIDPLDGSSNATKNIPLFNISVAVCEMEVLQEFSFDKVLIGVIYSPISENIYYSKKGEGSFINGLKIVKPIKKKMDDWYVGAIFKLPSLYNLSFLSNFKSFRCFGCATEHICSLVRGDNQAYFAFDNKLRIYDIAAAGLILREAGGVITDLGGMELKLNLNDKINFLACSHKDDIDKLVSFQKNKV